MFLLKVALNVLSLNLITLRLPRLADVLHKGAVAGSFVLLRAGVFRLLAVDHPVVAASHEPRLLFGTADRARRFGDVWEVGKPRDVVQQAGRLSVVGVAVGVAIFLLDVPP